MKTKGPKENFRVVIEPRGLGDFGSIRVSASFLYGYDAAAQKRIESDMQDRCDEIAADVKRHVDNAGYVSVEFDQEDVCEHCGSRWSEESAAYNGGCCAKDEEANPEPEAA
jgi:hypothetical protein